MKSIERHPKGWGEEIWIANTRLYCGKKLVLKKGKRCSVHYHKEKDETFYLQGGLVQLDLYTDGFPGDPDSIVMEPGDSIHIPVGLPHRFTGLEDSEIFEFSTEHKEEDSYRLAPGDSQILVDFQQAASSGVRVCYFGIYDPNFSRNKVYLDGFKQLGVEVVECRDDSHGPMKFWRLWRKHRAIAKKDRYDALIVGYPGHMTVPLAKLITRKPVVVDMLGSLSDAEKHSHNANRFRLAMSRLIDWMAVKYADVVLLESHAQISFFEHEFGGAGKHAVVYTGVNESLFYRKPDEPYSTHQNGKFTVFFRGKLTPECGIEHILNAAEILKSDKDIAFKIIGRGYHLEKTKKIIEDKRLDNVELISRYLPDEEMRRSILSASLFLGQFEYNHRLKRTIPHKTFEAFAMGIPFLTESTPAIRELVTDGETGFLVPFADPKAIAKKIKDLSRDRALLEKVSNNARKMFEERLSSKSLANEIKSHLLRSVYLKKTASSKMTSPLSGFSFWWRAPR